MLADGYASFFINVVLKGLLHLIFIFFEL